MLKTSTFRHYAQRPGEKCGLGHGLLEKPYENALIVEFGLNGIPFKQQPRFDVIYESVRVGEYFPDLIVFDQIVSLFVSIRGSLFPLVDILFSRACWSEASPR